MSKPQSCGNASRALLRVLGMIVAVCSTPPVVVTAAPPTPPLVLDRSGAEGLRILHEGKVVTAEQELRNGKQPVTIQAMTVAAGSSEGTVILAGSRAGFAVEATGFAKWKLEGQGQDKAHVRVDSRLGVIEVTAEAGNEADLVMRLGGESLAHMRAGSFARYDLFKDGSYYVFGGANLHGVNEDGLKFTVSSNRPPATGGPVAKSAGAGVANYFSQATPTVRVRVNGALGGVLDVVVGTNKLSLPPQSTHRTELANGAMLELNHDSAARVLRWVVAKGDFRVSLRQFPGFEAITLTEQQGLLAWDDVKRSVEFGTPAGQPPILTVLPGNQVAAVPAGERLQVTRLGEQEAVYEIAGPASSPGVYDLTTGHWTAFAKTPLRLAGGVFEPAARAGVTKVTLGLGSASLLEIHGAGQSAQIARGTAKTLNFANGSLRARAAGSGVIVVEAVQGGFELSIPAAGNSVIALRQGDLATMALDTSRGLLGVRAHESNPFAIALTAGAGFSTWLQPQAAISLSFGPAGILGAAADPEAAFPKSALAVAERGPAAGGQQQTAAIAKPHLGPSPLAIRVAREAEDYEIFLDGLLVASTKRLAAAGGTLSTDILRVTLDADGETLHFKPRKQDAVVRVDEFAAWSAQVPSGAMLTLRVNSGLRVLDQSAPKDNPAIIRATIGEDAVVELKPGATLRYDLFSDDSFVLSSETTATGQTADGFLLLLSNDRIHHSDGPIKRVVADGGMMRVRAARPTVEVRITGALGEPLALTAGTNSLTLAPGQTNGFNLPNSTGVEFAYDAAAKRLHWHVRKGEVRFVAEAAPNWRPFGLTGQRGSLGWDAASQSLDVVNHTGVGPASGRDTATQHPGPLWVAQPDQTLAAVPVGGSRQFKTTPGATVPEPPTSTVRLSRKSSGYVLLQGDKFVASTASLLAGPKDASGFMVALSRDGESLILAASSHKIVLAADEFAGWSTEILPGTQAGVRLQPGKALLDVLTPASNAQNLPMEVHDGTRMDLRPNRTVRYDVFRDRSYYIASDGPVSGRSSDGAAIMASSDIPPFVSGPIERSEEKNGVARLNPLIPTIPVRINGKLGGAVTLTIGTNVVLLGPGYTNRSAFANGSVIDFNYGHSSRSLWWTVLKGDFRFTVQGIDGWQAVGLTDQSAMMVWDFDARAIDLKNTSPHHPSNLTPQRPILVVLPNRTSAIVGNNATFQFSSIGPNMYASAAVGGEVLLGATGSSTKANLEQSNLQVVDGKILRAGGAAAGKSVNLSLLWDAGAPLDLAGGGKTARLDPNSERTLEFGGNAKLALKYAMNGELIAEVIEGNVTLQVASLNGMLIELREGELITMSLDQRRGMFGLRANGNNSGTVSVMTGGDFSTRLPPGGTLSFNVGNRGLVSVSSGGNLLFSEGGMGSSSFGTTFGNSSDLTSATPAPGSETTPPLDTSRIPVAAVSPAVP